MVAHFVNVRTVHHEDASRDEIGGPLWDFAIYKNGACFQVCDPQARSRKTSAAHENAAPDDRGVFTTERNARQVNREFPLRGWLLVPQGEGSLEDIDPIA